MNGLRRLGRALLLWLVRWLPVRDQPEFLAAPRSVLVVRTDDRVGNLLLTTPLLAALREAFPHARVGLLCAARRAPVVAGTGLYDELWPFEKRDLFRRPWRFVALLWRLRAARYDVALDCGHFHAFSFTSAALVLWSGAPVRIGHDRGEARHFLTVAVPKDPGVAYDAAAKLELLRPLGVRAPLGPLLTELGKRRAPELAALIGGGIVLNPGSRKRDRRWSEAGFAEAGRRLAELSGRRCWVSWGPGEESLARQVAERADATLLPPTDLEGLAAAFRAAGLVITNDTGPMHLSVAVGAPTVAVFVHDDARRWGSPQRTAETVLAAGLAVEPVVAQVVAAGARLLAGQAPPAMPAPIQPISS